MDADEFRKGVLDWFDRHGRKNLPWQIERNPYRVWISEIMLQQTQVATVIPYFLRFMDRFPDVAALAGAPLDEVIAHWAGLGYYARARNLHRAAVRLTQQFDGRFPEDVESIQTLPGIGRSTAGAIVSLGMNRRASILDGNVKRVLCRYAGIEGWPGELAITRQLWELGEALTPHARVADYNQAMMDLGAMVCAKRRPACMGCPLESACIARRLERIAAIPAAKPRRQAPVRQCFMLVLQDREQRFWLETRPPTGIWGGLRSLPEFESLDVLQFWCSQHGVAMDRLECLPRRRHDFSHYHLDFVPVMGSAQPASSVAETSEAGWFSLADAGGLPAPVRRLLLDILDNGPVTAAQSVTTQ